MSQCVACTEAEDADTRHRRVAAQCFERIDGANDGAIAAASKDGPERAVDAVAEDFFSMRFTLGKEKAVTWDDCSEGLGQAWSHAAGVGVEHNGEVVIRQSVGRDGKHKSSQESKSRYKHEPCQG